MGTIYVMLGNGRRLVIHPQGQAGEGGGCHVEMALRHSSVTGGVDWYLDTDDDTNDAELRRALLEAVDTLDALARKLDDATPAVR